MHAHCCRATSPYQAEDVRIQRVRGLRCLRSAQLKSSWSDGKERFQAKVYTYVILLIVGMHIDKRGVEGSSALSFSLKSEAHI
jgi:hypothetical protein